MRWPQFDDEHLGTLPGIGQQLAGRVDHAAVTGELGRAVGAGVAGGGEIAAVLDGARDGGDLPDPRTRPAERGGRDQQARARKRQRARHLGKGELVADEHAARPAGDLARPELGARGEELLFAAEQMRLDVATGRLPGAQDGDRVVKHAVAQVGHADHAGDPQLVDRRLKPCQRAPGLGGALHHGLVDVVSAQEQLGKDDQVDGGLPGLLEPGESGPQRGRHVGRGVHDLHDADTHGRHPFGSAFGARAPRASRSTACARPALPG